MRFLAAFAAAFATIGSSTVTGPSYPVNMKTGKVVPGQYLVKLVTGTNIANYLSTFIPKINTFRTVPKALNGFTATLSSAQVTALSLDPLVKIVSPNKWVSAAQTTELLPNTTAIGYFDVWHLDRIDKRDAGVTPFPFDYKYTYGRDGTGIAVYVVDSGVYTDHAEFAGRQSTHYDTYTGLASAAQTDECGHGTGVASVALGSYAGVAKGATLHSIKVLGSDCTGTLYQIAYAAEWIISNHAGGDSGAAVVNLSLQTTKDTIFNSLVDSLSAESITVVSAAGNSQDDACNWSPGSAPTSITVASMDHTMHEAWYTNWGLGCVDFFAPGNDIIMAGIGNGPNYFISDSGTSFAAPQATGAAAIFLQGEVNAGLYVAPIGVRSALYGYATLNAVGLSHPDVPGHVDGQTSTTKLLWISPTPTTQQQDADAIMAAFNDTTYQTNRIKGHVGIQPTTTGLAPSIVNTGNLTGVGDGFVGAGFSSSALLSLLTTGTPYLFIPNLPYSIETLLPVQGIPANSATANYYALLNALYVQYLPSCIGTNC